MIIRSLILQQLRNHAHTSVEFCDGINVLHGSNGAGKTTILEALTLCAFTKTFLPSSDDELAGFGSEGYSISCTAQSDLGTAYKMSIQCPRAGRKIINSSLGNSLSPKDIVGEIPMIVLSPDFKAITFGSPQDRRAFIDRLLSQCSRRYYEDLNQLRRVLKQRNLLLSARGGYFDRAQFTVWTEQLIQTSTDITLRRRDFVRDFLPYFLDAYATLSPAKEHVGLQYLADAASLSNDIESADRTEIRALIEMRAKALEEEELRRQVSLWGPQKDDLDIRINAGRARECASQGQHKSLLICLKKAEFDFLAAQRSETPILLLDDVFSELDEQRTSRIFATVLTQARQSFITTTEPQRIQSSTELSKQMRFFRIEDGRVVDIEDIAPSSSNEQDLSSSV